MSDPLASTLAELRRRLETEAPAAADEGNGSDAVGGAAQTDLWQLSEMELDRLMGRRLDELHRLLPPDPELPVPRRSLPHRLRQPPAQQCHLFLEPGEALAQLVLALLLQTMADIGGEPDLGEQRVEVPLRAGDEQQQPLHP